MNSKSLKILNKAVKDTNGSEFRTLYYILNGISMGMSKFYKDKLADELNISTRQLKRIIETLTEKEFIVIKPYPHSCVYLLAIPNAEEKPLRTPKKQLTSKEQYQECLKDKRWLKKREEVFERYGHQCVMCGSTSNLHIHHLKYENGKKPWEYDVSKLIPLCKKCHEKVHSDPQHQWNPYKKLIK